MKDKLVIGIIQTSYGVNGEVKVKSLSGETEHFHKLEIIYLKKRGVFYQFRVEERRVVSGSVILKLEGVNTPEQGKELSRCEIWVARENASILKEDEYYYGDLFQCDVMKESIKLGKVKSIFEAGVDFILEIECLDKKTFMLPFADDYIDDVDIKNNKIIVRKDAEIE
ncbi:MAG: 16S rRNA processing protein RimM [Spirochaetales bacterium]|nr:16S rRNA processing protein RimM [Spirochaetales bacterium]